ncbi:MAG: glycerate kinase [Kiritimatiellae bacterium]|nr:glycerate kinase [Kiritimatiellia bacterium]MDD5520485.1 glycerate kinase [Kiritimatiellia bacterium]
MNYTELAVNIFKAGIESVKPDRLIKNNVTVRQNLLTVGGQPFDLRMINRIYVVGAGKASGLMAQTLEEILGDHISGGTVVVKYGHKAPCKKIEILEAGHPYPDAAGIEATRRIVEICRNAGENDLVLFLLSGGGSALLADYPENSSLEEMMQLSKILVNSGATINEINAVRKHLSRVKGGQLARLTHPAKMVSLMLSDVVGDPLDVIASGPTIADPSTFSDAIKVLKKYKVDNIIPRTLLQLLVDGCNGKVPETPKSGDPLLKDVANLVIGNNMLALKAGLQFAETRSVTGKIIADSLEGNTGDITAMIVKEAVEFKSQTDVEKPFCLLFGGETTLKVTGNGLGGRNQHMALKAASLLRGQKGIAFLAGGTDGTDGPTDMAGAVVDCDTWNKAASSGIDAQKYLDEFNSFYFFKKAGGHVFTGPTMTNVMDMVVVILYPAVSN